MRKLVISGLIGAALLAALSGCASNDPTFQAQAKFRREGFNFAAKTLVEREQKAPGDLAADFRYIDARIKHDVNRTGEDFVLIQKYIQQDVDRFISRLPDYAAEFNRQMRGKPEDIPRNAIICFY